MSGDVRPIQRGFEYEVRLAVSIPLTWANLLKQASQHHYDYKCRETGKQGVINALYNTAFDGEWPSTYPVSFSDLNLVSKVAEQLHHHTEDHLLVLVIRAWLQDTMEAIVKQREVCMELPGTTEKDFPELSDPAVQPRLEDSMQQRDIDRLARAIRDQVAKFSDRRLNDGDDLWCEREIAYRHGIAETATAVCAALHLDAAAFAAACGLYVSNGLDSYSDCPPGELTWEKPRGATP